MEEDIQFKIDPEARDRIGNAWVALMESRIADKSINATESAIIVRLLIASGYSLDPTRIPKGLQTKLTETIDLSDAATAEELGIVPILRNSKLA